jgi:hypothetical protein
LRNFGNRIKKAPALQKARAFLNSENRMLLQHG